MPDCRVVEKENHNNRIIIDARLQYANNGDKVCFTKIIPSKILDHKFFYHNFVKTVMWQLWMIKKKIVNLCESNKQQNLA